MAAGSGVLAGVLVRRGVAAGDVAAAAADPQVHPLPAGLQAVLATGHRFRRLDSNLIEMRADRSHRHQLSPLAYGRAAAPVTVSLALRGPRRCPSDDLLSLFLRVGRGAVA